MFYQHYTFKISGNTLVSVSDFVNATAGTEFVKNSGQVYVKDVTGVLKKVNTPQGNSLVAAFGAAITIPADTNLQTWANTATASGLYNIELTVAQGILPIGIWNIDFYISNGNIAGSTYKTLTAHNISGSTVSFASTSINGTWGLWAAAGGGGGGTGIIAKYNAVSDGIKTVYSVADWVENGFLYKTGANAIELYYDGVYQYNAFTETSPNTITLVPAPTIGTKMLAVVTSGTSTAGAKISEYRFVGNGTQTVFGAADMNIAGFAYTVGNHELMIDLGSAMQNSSDYIESTASSITFNVPVPNGVIGVVRVYGSILLADALTSLDKNVANGLATLNINSEVIQSGAGAAVEVAAGRALSAKLANGTWADGAGSRARRYYFGA